MDASLCPPCTMTPWHNSFLLLVIPALHPLHIPQGAKLPALLRLVLTHDARTPAVAPNAGAAGAGRATSLASTSPTSPPRPLTSHVSVRRRVGGCILGMAGQRPVGSCARLV